MRHSLVMWKWIVGLVVAVAALTTVFAVGGAVSAMSRLPELQPWHRLVTTLEPDASEIDEAFPLAEYLRREEAVFREARTRVDDVVEVGADPAIPNRYVAASRSAPARLTEDFNRTREQVPTEVRGGALLVHGLTDGPYSMSAIADRLHAAGYYTLSLRMQGHGTVPGGLVKVTWEDWAAAVRMGARHVRRRIGEGVPLRARRLLQRRRAGHGVRARSPRRRSIARAVAVDSGVADDRRVAFGRDCARDQPARPSALLREGAVDRHRARVQPGQVPTRSPPTRPFRPPGSPGRSRTICPGRPTTSASIGSRPCWRFSPWSTRRSVRRRSSPTSSIGCRPGATSWCCSTSIDSQVSTRSPVPVRCSRASRTPARGATRPRS